MKVKQKANYKYIDIFLGSSEAKMGTIQTLNVAEYIKKINRVESMLEEIKIGLSYFDNELQKSIKKGEKDIQEGRVTVCKTKEDLDNFFASI